MEWLPPDVTGQAMADLRRGSWAAPKWARRIVENVGRRLGAVRPARRLAARAIVPATRVQPLAARLLHNSPPVHAPAGRADLPALQSPPAGWRVARPRRSIRPIGRRPPAREFRTPSAAAEVVPRAGPRRLAVAR